MTPEINFSKFRQPPIKYISSSAISGVHAIREKLLTAFVIVAS